MGLESSFRAAKQQVGLLRAQSYDDPTVTLKEAFRLELLGLVLQPET